MTDRDIFDLIGARGKDFSRDDLARVNDILIELPVEQISDTRAWALEALHLIVCDPEYAGDLMPEDVGV